MLLTSPCLCGVSLSIAQCPQLSLQHIPKPIIPIPPTRLVLFLEYCTHPCKYYSHVYYPVYIEFKASLSLPIWLLFQAQLAWLLWVPKPAASLTNKRDAFVPTYFYLPVPSSLSSTSTRISNLRFSSFTQCQMSLFFYRKVDQ